MKFLSGPKDSEIELNRLIRGCKTLRWAVAWASYGFPLFDLLVQHQTKIQQMTVGLHFYQTHPDFIDSFMNHDAIRFVMDPSALSAAD